MGLPVGVTLLAWALGTLPGLAAAPRFPSPLVLIGGGPPGSAIVAQALSLAGGSGARVAVLPLASDDPEQAASAYRKYLDAFGVQSFGLLSPTHASAASPEVLRQEASADLLFFPGGDQRRLVSALDGTPLLGAILDAWMRGAVIAGTSAGAMPWGSTYIANGTSRGALADAFDRDAQGRPGLELERGLRLVDDLLVDTHFDEDQRLGRLLLAEAATPSATAIGVDEGTAAILTGQTVHVIGAGAVTVLEAPGLLGDNAMAAGPSDLFAAGPFEMERLVGGQSYVLGSATPMAAPALPAPTATPAPGGFFGWFAHRPSAPPSPAPGAPVGPHEPITIIGDPVPPPQSDAVAAFVRDSGGTQARILILAGDGAARDAEAWRSGLLLAGAGSATIQTATDLHDQSLSAALEQATGIFFLEDESGTLLVKLNAGQRNLADIAALYASRLPVAAAGLGMRILGDVAYFGRPGGTDREVMAGLHLLPGTVADDGFWGPSGLERLIQATLMAGHATGFGLGPGSALRVTDGQALAMGSQQIVVLEGHGVQASTLPATDSVAPASATGLEVSVLAPQGVYDLVGFRPRF